VADRIGTTEMRTGTPFGRLSPECFAGCAAILNFQPSPGGQCPVKSTVRAQIAYWSRRTCWPCTGRRGRGGALTLTVAEAVVVPPAGSGEGVGDGVIRLNARSIFCTAPTPWLM